MSNFINANLTGRLSVGQGERGKSLEYEWRGTELGIRVEGEEEYNFVDLAGGSGSGSGNGVDGREIELQLGNGYLQWRYKGEDTWQNLIAISELKGEKGDDGEQGIQGLPGKDGRDGAQGLPGKDGENGREIEVIKADGAIKWRYKGQENGIGWQVLVSLEELKGEKGDKGADGKDGEVNSVLVTTKIVETTLTLTKDKYQTATMENNTTIVLPSVNKFTEIHLFFTAESELTLILPDGVKWQAQPVIKANKTYEFIFTSVNNEWLGGYIQYE